MNDLKTLRQLSGPKCAIGENLPGFALPLISAQPTDKESIVENQFVLVTARIAQLRESPFSVVYERLQRILRKEGFLLLGETVAPARLDAYSVIFAQRFCQKRGFEFLTMNFEGKTSFLILRKIAAPGTLTDPNTMRPLRYVLVDRVYGFFLKFPRLKKFLKTLMKTMLFRRN